MKQIATVMRMLDEHTAQVSVVRRSACAHDCGSCSGCGAKSTSITVRAKVTFPVEAGDKVELYSDNRVLGYAALVYLVPIVLFLAGYLCLPDVTETVRYLCAFAGFLFGIVLAVICDRLVRRSNAMVYQIIRKI